MNGTNEWNECLDINHFELIWVLRERVEWSKWTLEIGRNGHNHLFDHFA